MTEGLGSTSLASISKMKMTTFGASAQTKRPENGNMADDPNQRFDRLLDAMAHGHAPVSGKKKPSGDQASDAERRAYCDETRTPRDTSEDASR